MPSFETMTDRSDLSAVVRMMNGLYDEDPSSGPLDRAGFVRTIDAMLAEPARGRVMLMRVGAEIVGYALLVAYLSNEMGGVILFVDEIYVLPAHRGRGLARAFFGFLERERPMNAAVLGLEVSPANARARALYESLGFGERRNSTLIRRL